MKNKANTDALAALAGNDFPVDTLGRVMIKDPKLLDMIQGALGDGCGEIPTPFWNGACSNQHC